MIKDDGFNEREAASFVAPLNPEQARLPIDTQGIPALTVTLVGDFRVEDLELTSREHVQWTPQTHELTIRGVPDNELRETTFEVRNGPKWFESKSENVVKALRRESLNMRVPRIGERFSDHS